MTSTSEVVGGTSEHTPSGPDPRTLLINVTIAAVLGAGLMVLAHEFAHLVAGLAQGVPGILYSYGVDHPGATPTQLGIAAIAGPVFSLVTGAVMAAWTPLRTKGGFGHLLWLMFAFASLMEGIGYLEIAPFGAGDTASAITNLGWPQWISLIMLAVGIAGQFALARAFAPHVGRHAGPEKPARMAFTLWPWLIATAINLAIVALNLSTARMPISAGEMVAIAAAGTAVLVFLPMSMIFQGAMNRETPSPLRLSLWPIGGLVALVVLLLVNQALNFGLSVG